jgi:putative SOS response-associated peptidase YedK
VAGRFTITLATAAELAAALGVPAEQIPATRYRPRYNLPPRARHWVVRLGDGRREAVSARWGLVNAWAKDARLASRQTNARSETLLQRPAFRGAARKRRCLVPMSGFFEWTGPANDRRPVYFYPADGRLLLVAGIYETWHPKPEEPETTFALVTTASNATVRPVKDRMVVILPPERAEEWLDPGQEDLEALRDLLVAPPDELLMARAVSPRANSIRNDDPACIEPVAEA